MNNINDRIRFIYRGLDVSQKIFAFLIGISRSYAQKLLSQNNSNISDLVLRAIAEVGGVAPEWLATGKGVEPIFRAPSARGIDIKILSLTGNDGASLIALVENGKESTPMTQTEAEAVLGIPQGSMPVFLEQEKRRQNVREFRDSVWHNNEPVNLDKVHPFVQQFLSPNIAETLSISDSLSAYTADPVISELLALLSQLDEPDRNRILQEAKDRVLLKEIRINKGREKAG